MAFWSGLNQLFEQEETMMNKVMNKMFFPFKRYTHEWVFL